VVGADHITSENERTRINFRRVETSFFRCHFSIDFFRFSRFRWLTPVTHSSFPLSIVLYVVSPGHIISENGRNRVPVCRHVVTQFFQLFSLQVTDASCPQQFRAVLHLLRCRAKPHHLKEQTHNGLRLSPRRHLIFSLFSHQVIEANCLQQFFVIHRFLRNQARPHYLREHTHHCKRLSLRRHSIFLLF